MKNKMIFIILLLLSITVLGGCSRRVQPPTPQLDIEDKVESHQFCFIDGYCLIKQEGVLYHDISGVNNTMPEEGTYYEVMYQ